VDIAAQRRPAITSDSDIAVLARLSSLNPSPHVLPLPLPPPDPAPSGPLGSLVSPASSSAARPFRAGSPVPRFTPSPAREPSLPFSSFLNPSPSPFATPSASVGLPPRTPKSLALSGAPKRRTPQPSPFLPALPPLHHPATKK
jgi:hypothetical protein